MLSGHAADDGKVTRLATVPLMMFENDRVMVIVIVIVIAIVRVLVIALALARG